MLIASTIIDTNKARVHASYTNETVISEVAIDLLPTPEEVVGMEAILFINPQSKELFYEYIEKPLSPIEEMLKRENAELKNSLADVWEVILMGGI